MVTPGPDVLPPPLYRVRQDRIREIDHRQTLPRVAGVQVFVRMMVLGQTTVGRAYHRGAGLWADFKGFVERWLGHTQFNANAAGLFVHCPT